MRTPKQILDQARAEGRVWIEGELEFEFGVMCDVAFHQLHDIASQVGAMVRKSGSSMVYVYPAFSDAYYVLDWYDGDRPGPWRITLYRPESAGFCVTREKDGTLKVTV